MRATGKIPCIIRKILVEATPEERVRQHFLAGMIESLGYPTSLITVEQELKQIPHLRLCDSDIPRRRADVICYGKGIHPTEPLAPLLLLECKAIPLNTKVINQVLGYNYFVGARFIAVGNQEEVRTGWKDAASGEFQFVPYLPFYADLIR